MTIFKPLNFDKESGQLLIDCSLPLSPMQTADESSEPIFYLIGGSVQSLRVKVREPDGFIGSIDTTTTKLLLTVDTKVDCLFIKKFLEFQELYQNSPTSKEMELSDLHFSHKLLVQTFQKVRFWQAQPPWAVDRQMIYDGVGGYHPCRVSLVGEDLIELEWDFAIGDFKIPIADEIEDKKFFEDLQKAKESGAYIL